MKKIEKHFNELMLIALITFIPLAMTSCSQDECTEVYNVEQLTQSRMSVISIDLSGMSQDVTLTPTDGIHEYVSTGDVNLNGYTLRLNNVRLTVQGNLNGGGVVRTNGNYGAYCVTGNIQNNPDLSQATELCETMSTPIYIGNDQIEADCGLSIGDLIEIDGKTYRIKY